jgi:hypothetical protein
MIDTEKYQPARQNMKLVTLSLRSLALIAKQLGHSITGQDQGVYPPMSTQLDKQSISYTQGYLPLIASTHLSRNTFSLSHCAPEV